MAKTSQRKTARTRAPLHCAHLYLCAPHAHTAHAQRHRADGSSCAILFAATMWYVTTVSLRCGVFVIWA